MIPDKNIVCIKLFRLLLYSSLIIEEVKDLKKYKVKLFVDKIMS